MGSDVSPMICLSISWNMCCHETLHAEKMHCKHYQRRFSMKIGGTVFDVTTHFNAEGRQTGLQQFQDLILSEHLV